MRTRLCLLQGPWPHSCPAAVGFELHKLCFLAIGHQIQLSGLWKLWEDISDLREVGHCLSSVSVIKLVLAQMAGAVSSRACLFNAGVAAQTGNPAIQTSHTILVGGEAGFDTAQLSRI